MPYQRHQRVESLIREELDRIILRELEFEEAVVTITGVEAHKDLETALIWVSVLPKEKSLKVMKDLEKNLRRLQHLLLLKINIKPMPQLRFQLDEGQEKAAEVERAFLDIEKDRKADNN